MSATRAFVSPILRTVHARSASTAAMSTPLTLYINKHCPYSQRVWWALEEVKADYKKFIIDPSNRPSWYQSEVISTGKVPVIAYGGPSVEPEQPSPESIKIPESSILLEFVADLFPDSPLMPKDPILKAKARLFMDTAATRFIPQYLNFLMRGAPPQEMFFGLQALQDMMPEDSTWILGDQLSIADLAIAPFFPRMELAFSNDLGAYNPGEGKKAYEILSQYPGFERYRKYVEAIKAREEFQKTFDQDHVAKFFTARLNALRAARMAQNSTA